jgi:hypothetical protein
VSTSPRLGISIDWHTVLFLSPNNTAGVENHPSKEGALEAMRKLLEEGYAIHAIQRGGITVMDGEAIHAYFKSPQSK